MLEQSGGEKTLPASPLKRQRAREEGRVARSQDLTSAFAMLVALLALRFFGPSAFRQLVAVVQYFFGEADGVLPDLANAQRLGIEALWLMLPAIVPLTVVMLLSGLAINMLQVGVLFTAKPLTPKIEKLNPFSGLANLINTRSLVELLKSTLKVVLVGYIVWITLRGRANDFVNLMELAPEELVPMTGKLVFVVWWRIVLAMIVLGVLDYGFQKWMFERDMMMTLQEAREELREFEGDPRIRQRIRQIQRQVAMQRMMKEVPKADVIITNPTRYAVALRYDMATMAAPVVVAKGARLLAERIRDIAVEYDVPIVQKPELARTLYATIEIGQPVPDELFRAVAEILAYVYRIDRRAEKVREREHAWHGEPVVV